MKCEDCQKVLDEYFDGELDERESVEVRAHLYNCEACSLEFEALKDEQNLYALYRRDVEVTPKLWAGVSARIQEEKSAERTRPFADWRKRLAELFGTPRLSPALTFALLILAVGATAGLMKYMQSRTATQQPVAKNRPDSATPAIPKSSDKTTNSTDASEEPVVAPDGHEQFALEDNRREDRLIAPVKLADKVESRRVMPATVGFTDEVSPDQLVREAEQKYQAAIILLSRDAKRRRTLLEPDVRARFDQTLAAVDLTIGETRRAVRQQPDDPVAVQYMLAAYAKKVEDLREIAAYKVDDRDIQ